MGDGGGVFAGLFHAADDGGADDGAVGVAFEAGEMFAFGEAEADTEGAVGELAHGFEPGGEIGGQGGALAGDAGDGEVVDEAGGEVGDFLAAVRGGRGGDEEAGVEAARLDDGAEALGFGGREVGEDEAIEASGFEAFGERVHADFEGDGERDHRDERDVDVLADGADCIENGVELDAFGEGFGEGFLDDGAVGDGVGEGDADFDEGGSGVRDGDEGLGRGFERGEARGNERHQVEFGAVAEGFRDGGGIGGGDGGHRGLLG